MIVRLIRLTEPHGTVQPAVYLTLAACPGFARIGSNGRLHISCILVVVISRGPEVVNQPYRILITS